MLKCSSLFVQIVLFLILISQSIFCQIVENANDSASIDIKDRTTDKNSLSPNTVKECFPPCREGFVCSDGVCISKCNPACPDNQTCVNDGNCKEIVKSQPVIVKRKLDEITNISRVGSAEDIMQGMMIKTNCLNSEVLLGDTNFKFDKELYLNTPPNRYIILMKAQGKNTKYQFAKVKTGSIDVFNPHLRPIRLITGISWGPALINSRLGDVGNLDVGIDVAFRHFFGFTYSYGFTLGGYEHFNKYDSIYPDTTKINESYLEGFGMTYGFTGIHLGRYITIIPKISAGYWRLKNQIVYEVDYVVNNHYKHYYISDWEKVSYEHYVVKPGIEMRYGYRVFGFRMHIDNFLGDKIGPFTINLGALFRIL